MVVLWGLVPVLVLLCIALWVRRKGTAGSSKAVPARGGVRRAPLTLAAGGEAPAWAGPPPLEPVPAPGAAPLAADVARLFGSGERSGERPPMTLAAVPPEVLARVEHGIATLKNLGAIQELQRVLGAETTMSELTRLITRNPLLSARVLQVANAPYYGMPQKLHSISHALMIIGMTNLKAILYREGVLRALGEVDVRGRPERETLWRHLNHTAIYASYIAYLFEGLNMGTLFTLGLLHDIGKFILFRLEGAGAAGEAGEGYGPHWTPAQEAARFGIDHALAGRLALQHWGLPPLMVDAVARHHGPGSLPAEELGVEGEPLRYLLVLYLADQAAHLYAGASGGEPTRPIPLHPSYHGLIDQGKLVRLLQDKALRVQLLESEAIAAV